MSRGVANALFLLLFFGFAFLHLYRLGTVTYTWDEGSDLGVVSCLQRTHDPFACLDDISQTRLPFYIHAIAHTPRSQYLISAAFSLFNFVDLCVRAARARTARGDADGGALRDVTRASRLGADAADALERDLHHVSAAVA